MIKTLLQTSETKMIGLILLFAFVLSPLTNCGGGKISDHVSNISSGVGNTPAPIENTIIKITNNKIFFISERDSIFDGDEIVDATHKLYKMNPDGTAQEKITDDDFDINYYSPSPSPDGSQITFARSDENHILQIFIMNSDGTGMKQLTSGTYRTNAPSFSWDGKYIVYTKQTKPPSECGLPTCYELFIMDTNGKEIIQLTHNDYVDHSPVFTPDGKKVVFVSGRPEVSDNDIYIISIDGKNEERLTDSSDGVGSNTDPSVSPDGKKIIFNSSYFAPYGIYEIDIDGTNPTLVIDSLAADNPKYSPDGDKIVYETSEYEPLSNRNWEICVYDVKNSETKRLTNIKGVDYQASWTP